jgi:hypothetical protein
MHWNRQVNSVIVSAMRVVFSRLLVLVLAAFFAASGAAARYCNVAHHSSGNTMAAQSIQVDSIHHAHASDHGAHEHYNHDGSTEQYGPADTAPISADSVACAQCCGTCTLVTAVVRDATTQAIFKVSPAIFSCKPDHCSHTTIVVDPGIPKRIV